MVLERGWYDSGSVKLLIFSNLRFEVQDHVIPEPWQNASAVVLRPKQGHSCVASRIHSTSAPRTTRDFNCDIWVVPATDASREEVNVGSGAQTWC